MRQVALVIAGAVVGGVVGYFLFFWCASHGLYALALPGGLLGVGAGWFRHRSKALPGICGVVALALGLFTEWRFAPFVADDSLAYFATHLYQLRGATWLMIAVGAAIGFWGPFSQYRRGTASHAQLPPDARP